MQGFWNFIVYCRPRFLTRLQKRRRSRLDAPLPSSNIITQSRREPGLNDQAPNDHIFNETMQRSENETKSDAPAETDLGDELEENSGATEDKTSGSTNSDH
jgi:hypothetical protein